MTSTHQTDAEPISRLNFVPVINQLATLIAGKDERWRSRKYQQTYKTDAGVCLAVLWHGWATARIKSFLSWCSRLPGAISSERRNGLHSWLRQKVHTLEEALISKRLLPVDVADQVVRNY